MVEIRKTYNRNKAAHFEDDDKYRLVYSKLKVYVNSVSWPHSLRYVLSKLLNDS